MVHTHTFRLMRPNGTIERCDCGKWRHSANSTNDPLGDAAWQNLLYHTESL